MATHHNINASAMEKGEAGLPAPPPSSVPSASTTLKSQRSAHHKSTFSKSSLSSLGLPTRWSTFSAKAPNLTVKPSRRKKYRVPVKTRRINDHSKGYPNVAAFLDSDEGFSVYRRFGYLQSRILLQKQEELRGLEEDLEVIETKIREDDDQALCYRELFGPYAAKHGQILKDIEAAYCSYSQILTAAQQMMSFNKPSESEYQSVGRYLDNRQALGEKEATWIQHKEDIITLRTGRDGGWLDDMVEGFLKLCHCSLVDWVFRSKETCRKTEIDGPNIIMPGLPPKDEDKYELYYTPSRISKLSNTILMFLVLVLLVLPIYLLYHMVHDIGTHQAYLMCIGTLLVFTLAFSSILSLFTRAKRHEILAAAAAYCAVLVVFLGNVVPPGAGSDGLPDGNRFGSR